MVSIANMVKHVETNGVLAAKAPKLFARHESKPKYRGIASFGEDGSTKVLLEVADTPELCQKGLSGRKKLPNGCGMLFTDLSGGAFWMKGCKIPLDIVFIDDSGLVTRKYTMAVDGGIKKYYYDDESTAIELPAGFCKKHDISVGTPCKWRVW